MLNASIEIDADALLTYISDPDHPQDLRVSVVGDVYTFASSRFITIASNEAGLTVQGDGTTTVDVTGLAALAIEVPHQPNDIAIASTNKPTEIRFEFSGSSVALGDSRNPAGLSALSAPVTVSSPVIRDSNTVIVSDHADGGNPHYTITDSSVTTGGGFGGLTYSGIGTLNVLGATNPGVDSQTFDVIGTSGATTSLGNFAVPGLSVFNVEDTSSGPNAVLNLYAGGGSSATILKKAAGTVNVYGGGRSNTLVLGADQDVSGVTARMYLNDRPFDVEIDDSRGLEGRDWTMTTLNDPYHASRLEGFDGGGSLTYYSFTIGSMVLKSPRDRQNRMTIDSGAVASLPTASGASTLDYDGGATAGSASASELVLRGSLIQGEVHDAEGPDSGVIGFGYAYPGDFVANRGVVRYRGLTPDGLYDLTFVKDYTLNDRGDPDVPLTIRAGEGVEINPLLQEMFVSAAGAIQGGYLAHKNTIRINALDGPSPREIVVDYSAPAPPADFERLIVASGGADDELRLLNAPAVFFRTFASQDAGDDRAFAVLPGLATPSLDGGPGFDVLTIDAGSLAVAPSNFRSTVYQGMAYTIVGSFTGFPAIQYIDYEQVALTNLASAPAVVVAPIHGARGQRLVDAVAATFTSPAPGARAADFLATIDWGDGSITPGTIVQDASNPPVFYVIGTHTYYTSGALAPSVTVASLGSSTTQVVLGTPVSFDAPASAPVVARGTATIDDSTIGLTVGSFGGVENAATPGDAVVAAFTDPGVDPTDPAPTSHYHVTIDWGDGTVVPVATSGVRRGGATNGFQVVAPRHVYARPGTYVVRVAVNAATATGVAVVADAPLTAAPTQPAIPTATEGTPLTDAAVAWFADANPKSSPSDFNVVIDWGDGSPRSSGSLIQPGGAGAPYVVVGTHAYAHALGEGAWWLESAHLPPPARASIGTYPIRVYVGDAYGSAVTLANTITVSARPSTVVGGPPPAGEAGAMIDPAFDDVGRPSQPQSAAKDDRSPARGTVGAKVGPLAAAVRIHAGRAIRGGRLRFIAGFGGVRHPVRVPRVHAALLVRSRRQGPLRRVLSPTSTPAPSEGIDMSDLSRLREGLVERKGIEPSTSALRTLRSPN